MKKFGEYLKSLRMARGLTLRQVEEISGVSNAYVCISEKGTRKNPPHPSILQKLAIAYSVPLNEMMEKAGYLTETEHPEITEEIKINRAFEYIIKDPEFSLGTRRIPGEITIEVKKFIIEMYEKNTGKKLL
jgi:transcriptional regulator with XRE-family HTH domain